MKLRYVATMLLLVNTAALAERIRFDSGVAQTTLIELYTSEGCSSCPPAEAWLNAYTERDTLWTRVIPLAFHVDYWNYLGWVDPYAQPAHALRQKHYARMKRVSTVYTPAFFVNGVGWQPGALGRMPPSSGQPAGNLRLLIDDARFELEFEPIAAVPDDLRFHIAVLGMGLTSEIRGGENQGRRSRHEFVVLAHRESRGAGARWQAQLPTHTGVSARHYAVAAWVSAGADPTPLQAVGGDLPSAATLGQRESP